MSITVPMLAGVQHARSLVLVRYSCADTSFSPLFFFSNTSPGGSSLCSGVRVRVFRRNILPVEEKMILQYKIK